MRGRVGVKMNGEGKGRRVEGKGREENKLLQHTKETHTDSPVVQ